MLYSVSRKQFVNNALCHSYAWTDLIRDSEAFNSKYYFDETDIYYLSTNYGNGETITIFHPYSESLYEKARGIFPYAVAFCFACSFGEYNANLIKNSYGLTFHYKLIGDVENTSCSVNVTRINNDNKSNLKQYDDTYLSFLRENHGARLVNYWKNNERQLLTGDKQLYLVSKNDETLIGFIMVEVSNSLKFGDISQITIEEAFQRQGYGKQALQSVIEELKLHHYDVYYSSVDNDNLASRNLAESMGFKTVACRINFNPQNS